MFVVFFTIAVFILTVFENTIMLGLVFLLINIIYISYFVLLKKVYIYRRKILYLFVAFLLAFTAVSIKQYFYQQNLPNNKTPTIIRTAHSEPQGNIYIGTGVIEDKKSSGRYILSDSKKRKYFLYSEKNYKLNQEVYLQANFKPGLTGLNLIYKFKQQDQDFHYIFSGFFQYQFDYPKRLIMKGYYGTLYEKSSISVFQNNSQNTNQKNSKISNIITKIKTSLQDKIITKYGSNKQAGLILGMLIGDRSEIPKYEYDEFIRSGLVHIIAVSGGNILMLVIFLSAILFFIPFYFRTFIILVFIILYAFICGMDSSVIRATLMGSLSILALFWGREIQIWRGLSIAFVFMLLFNPYFLIYDVGFILSFSAIFGLIFMQKYIAKLHSQKTDHTQKPKHNKLQSKLLVYKNKILNNYFYPTLGASIGVFPVLIFFMGEMNLLGIIGNIFILPIIPFVMIYGIISVFLYDILHRAILLNIETGLINYIYRVSKFLSEHGLYIKVNNQYVKYLIFLFALIGFIILRFKKERGVEEDGSVG